MKLSDYDSAYVAGRHLCRSERWVIQAIKSGRLRGFRHPNGWWAASKAGVRRLIAELLKIRFKGLTAHLKREAAKVAKNRRRGRKLCRWCETMVPRADFYEDHKAKDGLFGKCRFCILERMRALRPLRKEKNQARARTQVLPRPSSMKCRDCGCAATDYDHFRGYSTRNALAVHAVCKACHGKRTAARNRKKKP